MDKSYDFPFPYFKLLFDIGKDNFQENPYIFNKNCGIVHILDSISC